jgi:hypothetical protein
MSRWFDEWARRNRPGTRCGSYDLGLTWQWVHVVHAHNRQFEHSLDDKQQLELVLALHKRA